MGSYPISVVEWNPPSLHEEQKNPQLESLEPNPAEKVLNMLRIMSHDIRGSLVSMSATLKLLSRGYYGKMEERVADHLKDLLSKTVSLIGITEEYLGQSFSVHDDLERLGETLDLKHDIINPVLEELDSEIKARDMKIENDLSPTSMNPILIKGNKVCLKTVFRNLLRNAIKHGDEGGTIAMGFEIHGLYVRFNIFNSGRPIPEEYRDKLFTKFMCLEDDGYAKQRVDGMGLGLYFVKTIIQEHGGDIWYEAKENGSNFVFTLPWN